MPSKPEEGARETRARSIETTALDEASARRARELAGRRDATLRRTRTRLVADALPVLVAEIGPDERCLFVNRAFAKLIGSPAGALAGRDVREVIGETSHAQVAPFIRRCLAGEEVSCRSQLHRGRGRSREVELRLHPLHDAGGEVSGALITGAVARPSRLARGAAATATVPARAPASGSGASRDAPPGSGMARPLAEAAAIGTWEYEPAGRRFEADARGRELVGLGGDGAIRARDLLARLRPACRRHVRRLAGQLGGDAAPRAFEIVVGCAPRRGAERWLAVTGRVFERDGAMRVWVGTLIDVTEARRTGEELRLANERLSSALRKSRSGVWDWDLGGDRLYWSDEFRELHGVGPATVPTFDVWLERVQPVDRRLLRRRLALLRGGEATAWDTEYRVRAEGVEERWLRVRGTLERDGGSPSRLAGIVLDISERKRAELALQQLNKTLELRVAERTSILELQTAQLRRLAHQLTQTEQRERKKLASTLHDGLQQMLVATRMRLRLSKGDPDIARVDAMIDESISVSRSLATELSPPVLHDADLPGALIWLARWFEDRCDFAVRVECSESFPEVSETYKLFLFHAVRELLLNVLRHAGVGAATVRLDAAADAHLVIEVADEGAGFDPRRIDAAEDAGGYGLFSIRERLEAFGGRLDAGSTPGRGSRVSLHLPVEGAAGVGPIHEEHAAPGAPAVGQPGQGSAGRIRVLLADDHRLVREGLATLLRDAGSLEVVGVARDGIEAIELAQRLQPDVVLIDVNLPRLDGIEATRRIKKLEPALHVIGLSLHGGEAMEQAMWQAGISAYLSKDSAADALLETIEGLCRR